MENDRETGAVLQPRRVYNPPNPYHSSHVEWLDLPPKLEVTVFEEECRSIISENDSPDISFRYSVNPYRGCFHACAYCYARPSHQYLDFGAGTDFESKIVAKINAPAKLHETLSRKKWIPDVIVFSGNTDCYQPLEASYELTRRCLEVCLRHRNPVAIITKGALIRRDIDILTRLQKAAGVRVHMSIAFNDDQTSKLIEPGAPRPSMRFRVMKELSEAGIPVSIAVAPIIPGLNDASIPDVLEHAKDCGASSAFMTLLRLPGPVGAVFLDRINKTFPSKFNRIKHGLQEARAGKLNNPQFGQRMVGEGAKWEAIEWMFRSSCDRLGLLRKERAEPSMQVVRPAPQLELPF